MKSFIRNFSTRLPILANRSSALERAVRTSPKSRRLRMEPLENRALLAVDALGTVALADVGESWGPDPAPAAFSASELSTDAETTVSLAALNAVPYGPYVNSEQAALIALRSNATLADATLADFTALWDETDVETTLADTTTDAETLNDVAESLTFEALDLGEIEQEPFPGDASVMSGLTRNSGGEGNPDDQETTVSVGYSGGNTYSGGVAGIVPQGVLVVTETMGRLQFMVQGSNCTQVTANFDSNDFSIAHYWSNDASAFFDIVVNADNLYEGDEITTITFKLGDQHIENYTVKIIDAPEFISGDDPEPNVTTNLVVNNDTAFAGFSTHEFTNVSPVNVRVYTPSAYKAHDVTYSLGENYSDTYSYFTLEEDNSVWYNNLQAGGLQYGTIDVPLKVRYSDDWQFQDSMTLTVTWADVNTANGYLRNKCNEYLANNSWGGYDCLSATENLQIALADFAESNPNAQHAVTALNLIELEAHQGCPCGGPHYAVLVTYCDNTTQIFDLIPDGE